MHILLILKAYTSQYFISGHVKTPILHTNTSYGVRDSYYSDYLSIFKLFYAISYLLSYLYCLILKQGPENGLVKV